MITITKTFSDAGVSSTLLIKRGESFNYSVDYSNDFDGGLFLEFSDNGGISYKIFRELAVGYKTDVSSTRVDAAEAGTYRFRCILDPAADPVALTGTAACTIATVSEVLESFDNQYGVPMLEITEDGVNLNTPTVAKTRFCAWMPGALDEGTSTTPGATTVYLTQIHIPHKVTLTGVAVNNGATVGTDKYVVALFDSYGRVVAYSALAGVTTTGADAFQSVAFTATVTVRGPATYWIGLYVNGTTDRFRSIPAVGACAGLAGTVTGQTFGTVVNVALPTTFTADRGPVAFVY
jgi:hypothetical protein